MMALRLELRFVALGAALLGLLSPQQASAQATGDSMIQTGEFSVQRFEPVAGPRNYLSVAGARTDGDMAWSTGLMFDYQRNPFVMQSCATAESCDEPGGRENIAVVQDMMTWNVLASLTPIPILQIGLRAPVVFASGQGVDTANPSRPAGEGLSAVGMGDINLEGKLRFFGEPDDVFALGGAVDVSAPTGHASANGSYVGQESPVTVGGRLIADLKVDGFSAAANLRGIWREDATFGDTTIGPEFRWGVGMGYAPHQLVRIIAEGYGATRFSDVNGTNALEIDGGIQLTPLEGSLVITAAGGAGVIKGIGVPLARAIFGIAYSYESRDDADGDGIPDDEDACIDRREDLDGIDDADGCPELDFDGDNIPDEVDSCPEKPETENRFEDDDGCPDELIDQDEDGVPDDRDRCPNQPGAKQGENIGCPDATEDEDTPEPVEDGEPDDDDEETEEP